MKGDDENEPNRWTSIGWQALLITNRLRCQAQLTEIDKQKESTGNENSDKDEKRALEERLQFVNRRLRDLERFEDRARGRKKD